MVTVSLSASDPRIAPDALLPIAAVERETGLGKDTLRAWERRYGFPTPQRDAAGMRGYPRAMVERLRLVRRALLAGERPGRLLALPTDQLDALLARVEAVPPAPAAGAFDPAACIAVLREGGAAGLRHWLTAGLARLGLVDFVCTGVAPLAHAIGEAWLQGRLAVHEEHTFHEVAQAVLRAAMLPFEVGLQPGPPRVLLATVPGEPHGFGLVLAQALLTTQACHCLPLGVQVPLSEIAAAAVAQRADIVVLAFTAILPALAARDAVGELRLRLPAGVALWTGGGEARSPRAARPAGVQSIARLDDLPCAVATWRSMPCNDLARQDTRRDSA